MSASRFRWLVAAMLLALAIVGLPVRTGAAYGVAHAQEVTPGEARRQATEILDQKRFKGSKVPRPLRGALRWIGDRTSAVTEPIGRFFADLMRNRAAAWLAALAVLALATWLTILLVKRRERARVIGETGSASASAAQRVDPRELDRQADLAEAEGRLEDALRLRFRAGLARLGEQGRVPRGVVEPSGEIAREVSSVHFDAVASTFDEVVYGRRPPDRSDTDEARTEWAALLRQGRR